MVNLLSFSCSSCLPTSLQLSYGEIILQQRQLIGQAKPEIFSFSFFPSPFISPLIHIIYGYWAEAEIWIKLLIELILLHSLWSWLLHAVTIKLRKGASKGKEAESGSQTWWCIPARDSLLQKQPSLTRIGREKYSAFENCSLVDRDPLPISVTAVIFVLVTLQCMHGLAEQRLRIC